MRTDYDIEEIASALLKRAGSDLSVKNTEDCKNVIAWIGAAAGNENNSDYWRTFWDTLQGIAEQERLHPTISSAMDFTVIEDSDGWLHLFVFDSNHNAVWGRVNYEFANNKISEDVQALYHGANPMEEGWSENLEDLTAQEVYSKFNSMVKNSLAGWAIIADQNGIYTNRMGLAGIKAFCSPEKEEAVSPSYTYKSNTRPTGTKSPKL